MGDEEKYGGEKYINANLVRQLTLRTSFTNLLSTMKNILKYLYSIKKTNIFSN